MNLSNDRSMYEPAVSVKNVSKRFGDRTAVDDVSFEVKRGEVYGLLGPNGAGKTTLLSILAGVVNPTSGTVRILGTSPLDSKTRGLVGFCPQEPVVYDELSGFENITFYAGLHGLSGSEAVKRCRELLDKLGLLEHANRRAGKYSGGMKKRLNFAIALIGDPEVLLLDEPTTGMDPGIRRTVWDLIAELRSLGKTVILATHYMEEAEALSDRVAIMDRGRVVAEGEPDRLKRECGLRAVINLELMEPAGGALKLVEPYAYEGAVYVDGNSLRVYVEDPDTVAPKLVSRLLNNGYKLLAMRISPPTLEDVFLKLTGRRLVEE